MVITVPPDLIGPLAEAARQRGTTPELFAVEVVRQAAEAVRQAAEASAPPAGTLRDFLAGFVGTVSGSGEAYSQNCGKRFADGLAEGRPARP